MGNGPPIDLAALARSLREDVRQPPRAMHRRTPDPPALAATRARYAGTRKALEEARSACQAAKAEHLRSKQYLAAVRAGMVAVVGHGHEI